MTSLTRATALPAAVLAAFLCGCARPAGTENASEPATPTSGSTVGTDDVGRTLNEPIEMVLLGRVPGVLVRQGADGSVSVRIRGVSSFYGSNEPLYVIDGVPVGPGGLKGLNPRDIASIQVLKDPADTAIYGIRGANGVIVVKTKGSSL